MRGLWQLSNKESILERTYRVGALRDHSASVVRVILCKHAADPHISIGSVPHG